MVVKYKGRKVGSLGKYGTNNYIFTIKTEKAHKTTEFKSKNLSEAMNTCQQILNNLAKNK